MAVTLGSYVEHLGPKVILIPALLCPLAGFLISYAFPAKYISQSLVLVEGQKVPESMVQPVVSQDLTARVATLQQQILSESRLKPIVDRVYAGRDSRDAGEIIDRIRANMSVEPVVTDLSAIGDNSAKGEKTSGTSPVPGFNLQFIASNAREAQQICNELTSSLVDENSRQVAAVANGTREVLNRGIEDVRNNLMSLGTKLASLKKQRGRESVTVDIEEQQKLLTIEYDSAQRMYGDLLAKKSAADLTITMNNMAQGERMFVLNIADLPDAPIFPNRLLFAVGGLGVGVVVILAVFLMLFLRSRQRAAFGAEPHVERNAPSENKKIAIET